MKIQVLDTVVGITEGMKTDGKVFVDLPQGFALEQFKSLEQLSINGIDYENVLEASVGRTPVNDVLARKLTGKNKFNITSPGYDVVVQEGSTVLNFFKLYFRAGGDRSGGYSIQLTSGDQHWLLASSNTYLNEVDYGTIAFDLTTFNNLNAASGYVDGEPGVVFPLVNYGAWTQPNDIVLEDFRPFPFVTKVLKDAFCHIGWNFASPVFESDIGRKIITYVLAKNFGQDPALLDSKRFQAGLDSAFQFTEEIFDNNDVFEESQGKFVGNGTHEFIIEIEGELNGAGDTPSEIAVFIEKSNTPGRIAERFGEGPFTATIRGEYTLQPGQFVTAGIDGDIQFLTITNAVFYNVPKASTPTREKTIKIQDFIGKYPIIDFIKGCVHLVNGKITTDWITKTVTIYSPYDSEWYSESIEGFFSDDLIDWTNKIIPFTEEAVEQALDKKRFQVFSFADSTDAYIRDLDLEEEVPLYSRSVDLGIDYEEGEDENRNPFFEPTYNELLSEVEFTSPLATNLPIDIPFMLDNTEGKLSYDIKPRVLFWGGVSKQTSDDGAIIRYFKLEAATTFNVPYAFQVPGSFVDNGLTISLPETTLTFEAGENSLYEQFYERDFKNGIYSNTFSYDAILTASEYNRLSFRKKYKAYYNGRTFVFRALEVTGRQTCKNAPVQVLVRPDAHLGNVCGGGLEVQVRNLPQIRVLYDDLTKEVSAFPLSDKILSPVQDDTFTYSTDNGDTFQPYTAGDGISAEGEVVFRRVVTYSDGSPEDLIEEVANIEKLCNNNPLIELDYNEEEIKVSAFALDNVESTIDSDVWEVSIDGASFVSYTPNTELTGWATLSFTRTISFTDNCPTIELIRNIQSNVGDCVNRPTLDWVSIADCIYKLQIGTANVDSAVSFVAIQVYNPITDVWRAWNGSPIRGEAGVKARAKVHYKGSCPSSTIESECPN